MSLLFTALHFASFLGCRTVLLLGTLSSRTRKVPCTSVEHLPSEMDPCNLPFRIKLCLKMFLSHILSLICKTVGSGLFLTHLCFKNSKPACSHLLPPCPPLKIQGFPFWTSGWGSGSVATSVAAYKLDMLWRASLGWWVRERGSNPHCHWNFPGPLEPFSHPEPNLPHRVGVVQMLKMEKKTLNCFETLFGEKRWGINGVK